MATQEDREHTIEILQRAGEAAFDACLRENLAEVKALVDSGAPLWYQEPDSGWTCLHAAANANNLDLIKLLLDAGAIWSSVDVCGFTAGDVALSLNNNDAYRLIKDSAVRSEFLLRTIKQKGFGLNENTIVLANEEDSLLASSELFLKSRLRYVTDSSGQQICMAKTEDGTEVGVMMGWEKPIMDATVDQLAACFPSREGLRVLNVGFGLGMIDTLIQDRLTPAEHYIIEPHQDVLNYMRDRGWYDRPGVKILGGKWQDFIDGEDLLGEGFDIIYTDTFSENFDDLQAFFERIPDLVKDDTSKFSFFNGLGATNAVFYDVYSDLAELHLSDIGLSTTWSDIRIDFEDQDVWGKTVVYFGLPFYRLPICQMAM